MEWDEDGLFCDDLKTVPKSAPGTVLVTGAGGYIGGRLVPELLARGYPVRAMLRAPMREYADTYPGVKTVVADALNVGALRHALHDVDTAFYLIHSLLLGAREFRAADLQAAANFRTVAAECGVRRIIYLGGLGEVRRNLSAHLKSRLEVARVLRLGSVPVTILRAAEIIGSGSASYEIIYHLVKNLPLFLMPPWARTRTQPISIRDVVKYLVGCLETEETSGQSYDIGGPDIVSHRRMLMMLAKVRGKRRLFLNIPFSFLKTYAYLTSLLTPVPGPITLCLMESVKDEMVCGDDRIRQAVPFETVPYAEAVLRAMTVEDRDRIRTRWSDSYPPAHELAIKLEELQPAPNYTASYSLHSRKGTAALFRSICRIGGKDGWFHSNWMWWLRGKIDRLLMGVGSQRGRRSSSNLRINDVIDFWRVEDLEKDRLLLLRAEMKIPGKAWLQFTVAPEGAGSRLAVTAYYASHGLLGNIYWYNFLPFHYFIFNDLIRQIERRSAA